MATAANGCEVTEGNVVNGEKEMLVEVEPKTGNLFPLKLCDGKQLNCVGVRKKSMLGMSIKIYAFGIYADNEKLKDVMKSKIGKSPENPTKEMYQAFIDSDVKMLMRMVIVYSGLTMNMVRKNFEECIGAAIKKLTGAKKNDDITNKVMALMGEASDGIKLTPGSIIEISRLPGFTMEAKVMGEVVGNVENELLCRAFTYMYLGEDPFDKNARERFGVSLLSLF